MGIVDMFTAEDRTEITMSKLYSLMKETAKGELLMNAVECEVPHKHIMSMANGKQAADTKDE